MKRVVLTLVFVLAANPMAFATWSVVAVNAATGEVVVASATCVAQSRFPGFPARDLMDIQAIVVPGKGAAAAPRKSRRTSAVCRRASVVGASESAAGRASAADPQTARARTVAAM